MEQRRRFRDTFSLSGWLFAELMLGLAMLFFAANTLGRAGPQSTPTTVPSAATPDWLGTIEAYSEEQTRTAQEEATAAAAEQSPESSGNPSSTIAALATEKAEVVQTATAYALITPTQLPSPTLVPTATSTTVPTPTPAATPAPTATSTATPVPDLQPTVAALATANASLRLTATAEAQLASPKTPTAEFCQETVVLEQELLTLPPSPQGPDEAELLGLFEPFRGQRIGLLQTFGHATAVAPGEGGALSRRVNAMLRDVLDDMIDESTIVKDYVDITGSQPPGSLTFEVYFLAEDCQ